MLFNIYNPLASKIISIHEEFDNPKAVENIKSDIHKVSDGVVAVLKNNNSFPIDLKASIVYCDDKGKMISNSSDENFCFESGKKCVLFFYAPEDIECNKINYAKYEITYSAKVLLITGHVSDIQQESNFGADNVMLKLTNSGKNNMNMTNVGILFYNKGEIIGCKTSFVNITKPGSIDTLEFSLPDNRDTSKVDDYKIFINYAYNLEL